MADLSALLSAAVGNNNGSTLSYLLNNNQAATTDAFAAVRSAAILRSMQDEQEKAQLSDLLAVALLQQQNQQQQQQQQQQNMQELLLQQQLMQQQQQFAQNVNALNSGSNNNSSSGNNNLQTLLLLIQQQQQQEQQTRDIQALSNISSLLRNGSNRQQQGTIVSNSLLDNVGSKSNSSRYTATNQYASLQQQPPATVLSQNETTASADFSSSLQLQQQALSNPALLARLLSFAQSNQEQQAANQAQILSDGQARISCNIPNIVTTAGVSLGNSDSTDTSSLSGTSGISNVSSAAAALNQYQQQQQQNHQEEDAAALKMVALSTTGDQRRRRGRSGTFPQKLHQMLSDLEHQPPDFAEIASFLPHGRAFCIHKPREFCKHVMPKYFRMSHFSSFQRQLNLYEFNRITEGPDKGAYAHPLFHKGRPILSTMMKRNKIKGVKKSSNEKAEEPCADDNGTEGHADEDLSARDDDSSAANMEEV